MGKKNVLSLQFPLPFVLFPLLHVHLFRCNPSYGNSSTQLQRLPRQFLRLRCSSPGKIGFIDGSLVKPDSVSRSGAYRNMAMDERYHHNLVTEFHFQGYWHIAASII
ncbi:hypothetical protein HN51_035532 [Arachis hypogaea]